MTKIENKRLLLQYAGFTAQLIVALGLSVALGLWIDTHFLKSMPWFVWLLPLIVLIALIVKVIKDTSK